MRNISQIRRVAIFVLLATCVWSLCLVVQAQSSGGIVVIRINGPINPAADDYLRSSLQKAKEQNAQLFVLELNTPGGLLTSMQTMVESLLDSPIPTVVYVSPSGAGAISAGVFITMAGNFAVMAPGTNIGAAHPVLSGGEDVKGHMGEKVENFAVSLIKAIAEQRGRNVAWAEQAVRESVAITDREALQEKVIDFVASDLDRVLEQIEGKTVTVKGASITLKDLQHAPRRHIEMNLKQKVVNILSDPNIAILLGLGAMLGIGIELYHPGAILPGVVGVVCLILSLTAGQVLPISQGGLALLLLGATFFVVELFIPSFGIWGAAGIICLVLGSIYFIDTDQVWSASGFAVDKLMVGTVAACVGSLLMVVCYLALKSSTRKVSTGQEGLIGKVAKAHNDFTPGKQDGWFEGRVFVMGEIWRARMKQSGAGETPPMVDEKLEILIVDGLTLEVSRRTET